MIEVKDKEQAKQFLEELFDVVRDVVRDVNRDPGESSCGTQVPPPDKLDELSDKLVALVVGEEGDEKPTSVLPVRHPATPEDLHSILGLVMPNPPSVAQLRLRNAIERMDAEEWAVREHLAASDNDVERVMPPPWLAAPRRKKACATKLQHVSDAPKWRTCTCKHCAMECDCPEEA